jgi:hypothetical protein
MKGKIILMVFCLALIPYTASAYTFANITGSSSSSSTDWNNPTYIRDGNLLTATTVTDNSAVEWNVIDFTIPSGAKAHNYNIILDDNSSGSTDITRAIYVYNFSSSSYISLYSDSNNNTDVFYRYNAGPGTYSGNAIRLNLSVTTVSQDLSYRELYLTNVNYSWMNITITYPLPSTILTTTDPVGPYALLHTEHTTPVSCYCTINTSTGFPNLWSSDYMNVANNTQTSFGFTTFGVETYNVSVQCSDSGYSYNGFSNFTVGYNFMNITVWDEHSPAVQLTYNMTVSNSTSSHSYTDITNYTKNCGDPDLLQGSLTFSISSAGYHSRTIYDTWYCTQPRYDEKKYLVATGDGLDVRFHIYDANGNTITNALVTANATVGGSSVEVESAYSDSSGTASTFLYPYSSYYIVVSRNGYNTYSFTIQPTQQDYTVTLTSSNATAFSSVFDEILYDIDPDRVEKAAAQNISLTVVSFNSTILFFSFNITDQNNVLLFSQNSTNATGGYMVATVNATNATKLTAMATINKTGESLYTVTKIYYPYNFTYGNYTIDTWFDYVGSAGMSDFSKMLIAVMAAFASGVAVAFEIGGGFFGGGLVVVAVLALFAVKLWIPWWIVIVTGFVVMGLYISKEGN